MFETEICKGCLNKFWAAAVVLTLYANICEELSFLANRTTKSFILHVLNTTSDTKFIT